MVDASQAWRSDPGQCVSGAGKRSGDHSGAHKIDLLGADPDRIKEEIEAIVGLDCDNAIPCSAKTGMGVPEILQAVVDRVPAPKDAVKEPTKALIFDSYYDPYRGVIVYLGTTGRINCKDKVLLMASKKTYELDEIGIMAPDQKQDELTPVRWVIWPPRSRPWPMPASVTRSPW